MVKLQASEIHICFAIDCIGAMLFPHSRNWELELNPIQLTNNFIACEITFKNNIHVVDVILILWQISYSVREINVCFPYYSMVVNFLLVVMYWIYADYFTN